MIFRFEDCVLDGERRELRRGGVLCSLEPQVFDVLEYLIRNRQRVVSRNDVLNAVWGGRIVSEAALDARLSAARRAIGDTGADQRLIRTLRMKGFRFIGSVREETRPSVGEIGPAPVASSPPNDDENRARGEAQLTERRQLTVLCCQIVGFAALAATLDPEDLDEAIAPVYAACAEVLARCGGTLVRALGDGVLAYFGYPKAQENDAESAVRAALELVHTVRAIEAAPIETFRARIGVATGLIVIGDAARSKEPSAVGEALNLALHMQKVARADEVVIAASTRDLVGRFFDCRALDPVAVEEGHEPAPAWRVIEEIAGMPRFDALRRDGMLPLVGREAELERLSQCWSKARRGGGQVVVLTGEPGIGKSRLARELQDRLRAEPHAALRYSGSPHRADVPMVVLLDELQGAAGLAPDDAAPRKFEKIQSVFAALGAAAATEAAALIAGLIGLPCEAPPQIKELAPHKRKERTFAALLARIEWAASQQPVFVVVEDAYWVDPISLEFFALLIERAGTLRLFLLIVGRADFVPPWPDHSYITTLVLSRLSRSDAAALVQQVAGERRVPARIEEQILSRADGVPLFVEELTKSVLETGADGGDGRDGGPFRASGHHAGHYLSNTLRGSLLARFDRLERGKDVAQAAAVIGREFSFELLRLITAADDATLASALDQIVAAGLVFRRGAPPRLTFVFKHALVRDAAYDMLPRRRRQKLHASVARSYEEHFPETVEVRPELLAYHCREAGEPIKAVGYLFLAAERELLRSAAPEALAHLVQARELISILPQDRTRLQLELRLEITLGRTLIAQHGYSAAETRAAYRRARARCEELGDQATLPHIIHGQWVSAWSGAAHRSALEEAQQLYAWAERNKEPAGMAVAHVNFGMTFTTLGNLAKARRHLEQSLQIDQFIFPGRQPLMFSNTEPSRISVLSYLQYCLLLLGFADQAASITNEAAALMPVQLYTRALAQIFMLRMHVFQRDAGKAAETGAAVLRLAQELGYPYLIGTSLVLAGWALAQRREAAAGIEFCQNGLAQRRTIGARCWLPFHLALLAECYEKAGDTERAAQSVAEALEGVEATGERVWEPEIYRVKGRLLDAAGDAGAAQVCFAAALAKARRQNAKLLELRAATNLADLLMHRDGPAQARAALAPVYASFTEGFDFVDLREAKALLDSLADQSETSANPRPEQNCPAGSAVASATGKEAKESNGENNKTDATP